MYKSCSRCGKIHDASIKCPMRFRTTTYRDNTGERKLRSTHKWTKKSKEIREKANYLCEVCRDKGIYNYKNLEVHHIDSVQDNPEKLLETHNTICLCQKHHKQADAGKIDREYLLMLAEEREARQTV